MTGGWKIFADVVQPGLAAALGSGWHYYAGLAVVVGVTMFAIVVFYREWQEMHDVEEPDEPRDLLDSFVQAHANGELDADELERVRRLLSEESGAKPGATTARDEAKRQGDLKGSAGPAPGHEPD